MNNVFDHVSDATRILREIKLLRLLKHADIVEIKHIMLPPSPREFKDIYVVFELMESDLHQVIKLNDDLTPEHHQFFLYQLLRGLKYIHTGNVFHRDLKPRNILANADCKVKLCDFGLARVSFTNAPSAIFWTDYVATRWYRAPELCGSFSSKACQYELSFLHTEFIIAFMYTPAIDIWSIGCIFAELLTGKPLFPGKNVVHQLELITDLLGTPAADTIARVGNEKARNGCWHLILKTVPSAEEALEDLYFDGLADKEQEPSRQPISKLEFEFERRKLTRDDVRELIYREILEYHPEMLKEHLQGTDQTHFVYPSGADRFKEQFAHLEEGDGKSDRNSPHHRKHATSLPRERICTADETENAVKRSGSSLSRATNQSPPKSQATEELQSANQNAVAMQTSSTKPKCGTRTLLRSDSGCASTRVGLIGNDRQVHAL
ncbi:MITOGEN-ACTIVATED PROTEIN KINASE [Salix koriyanagi]|uniref:MITOGEN-ACTIVATED PROTEIN KINASE n=1 Tax=Salix koriyanagi TaxID=2511006 RepID=A0A9Q0WR48_9ROSI|nr:MITOGEN-ACTIVATED PROTEIN KINASE [Salix koriyanagi]